MDVVVLVFLIVGFGFFVLAALRWRDPILLIALGLAAWILTELLPALAAAID